VSDRNHLVSSGSSDSFSSFNETDPPPDTARGFREGLPPAFRMRADAHYVEQLDSAKPTITVQYIAVHAIEVRDASADVLPELVESIKRYGVLEPLVCSASNGTVQDHHGAEAARGSAPPAARCAVSRPSRFGRAGSGRFGRASVARRRNLAHRWALTTSESALDVAVAAMRLIGAAPDGQVSGRSIGHGATVDDRSAIYPIAPGHHRPGFAPYCPVWPCR
jgi:hypothetical protein